MNTDTLAQEAAELLRKMIAIPSVSREEQAVADMLEQQMAEWQLKPLRHGHNLWCMDPHFDKEKPTILLNAHTDTVRPVAGWTRDPFTPIEENGRLYGLGTNDDGASVVSLLQTFRYLTASQQKCPEKTASRVSYRYSPPSMLQSWANLPACNPPSLKKD